MKHWWIGPTHGLNLALVDGSARNYGPTGTWAEGDATIFVDESELLIWGRA